jgi:LemA protein
VIKRLWPIGLFIFLLLVFAAVTVNTIPAKEEAAMARWADVQAQYQRRADLIPNLVATVEGYANQEKSVLTAVTEARASATQIKIDAATLTDPAAFEKYQAAQAQLSGVLGRLMAISESYPDLKSNQNFLALQSQLEGTENRVAIARRDFNEAVRDYNTTLRTLPNSIWAATFYTGAKPMQLFTAEPASQEAPKVAFPASPAPEPPK